MFFQVRRFLATGNDTVDLGGRWHETVPAGRCFPEVCHDFPSLWSQFHLTIPAALSECPQRIGKPDGWGVLWFGRALPTKYEVSQGWYLHTAEWGFTREDLEKVCMRTAKSPQPYLYTWKITNPNA